MSEHVKAAHRHAMDAKERIFKAQDATSWGWAGTPPRGREAALLKKLERRLARVRHELEQLDNDVRAVLEVRAPLGSASPLAHGCTSCGTGEGLCTKHGCPDVGGAR